MYLRYNGKENITKFLECNALQELTGNTITTQGLIGSSNYNKLGVSRPLSDSLRCHQRKDGGQVASKSQRSLTVVNLCEAATSLTRVLEEPSVAEMVI